MAAVVKVVSRSGAGAPWPGAELTSGSNGAGEVKEGDTQGSTPRGHTKLTRFFYAMAKS